MVPGIIFTVIAGLLFGIAYLLYFRGAYWLISGINFSPRETVYERYDIPGLTRHLGRMCAILGLLILFSGAFAFTGHEILFMIPILLIFPVLPIFLFGAERYMYVGRRTQRIANIAITILMAAVLIFTAVTMISGAREPVVEIHGGTLVVESMYGAEIPLDSIRSVDMTDLAGKKIAKLNGYNLGNVLKGRFTVEGIGSVTMWQQGTPCNAVLIRTENKTYLINLGDVVKNQNLRTQIIAAQNAVDAAGREADAAQSKEENKE